MEKLGMTVDTDAGEGVDIAVDVAAEDRCDTMTLSVAWEAPVTKRCRQSSVAGLRQSRIAAGEIGQETNEDFQFLAAGQSPCFQVRLMSGKRRERL